MLKTLVRVAISLLFIGFLIYLMREDFPEILSALKNINKPLFLTVILVFIANALTMAKRLQLIFSTKEVKLKLVDSWNLTFIGYFFNNFLPTAVGGDIVKAMCASRVTREAMKSGVCVLMDRIFGLFTFIVIPSVSLLFYLKQIQNPLVPVIIYSLLFVSLFSFFLLFNRDLARRFKFIETALSFFRIAHLVRKIYDGLHAFKDHKKIMVSAMLLSVAGQSVSILVIYWIAMALGAHTPIIYFFLLVPVVHLLSMLPSLNGLGIRESAYIYFLAPYMGREYAAALGILWLLLLFILSFIGGLIYLLRHDYHVQFRKKEPFA